MIQMIGPHSAADTGIWRTKDGKLIPIQEISDSHLENLIPYCERWRSLLPPHECPLNEECDEPIYHNINRWLNIFILEEDRRASQ